MRFCLITFVSHQRVIFKSYPIELSITDLSYQAAHVLSNRALERAKYAFTGHILWFFYMEDIEYGGRNVYQNAFCL